MLKYYSRWFNKTQLQTILFCQLFIQFEGNVMEDRRITKTKKNLKGTLISMLPEQPFEQISITELCARAEISRITFYSHYSDKYALVDEIFQDMVALGTEDYEKMQQENNPGRDEVISYCNILDAIMELYYSHYDFFRYTAPEHNPYLAFAFYSIVLETVEDHTKRMKNRSRLRFSPKQIAGFLCYGIIGFFNEGHAEKVPVDRLRREAKELLMGVLRSRVLIQL